jgi:folate-dependent phosphoribosylglycinamide formyltransferase PurN
LRSLLADPNRGSTWELSIVVGSETTLAEAAELEEARVPLELRPMRMVHAFRNLHAREDYDDDLGELFTRLKIQYVLLAGWQYIVTPRLLARFEGRILGLHHADLSIRDERLYAGPHPVRDAILAGETETRSSVYLLTKEVARGPLFLLSGAFPIAPMAQDAHARGNADFLMEYADLHERWMASEADGAMLVRTLELLAGGTTQVVHDVVWIDGAPGPCRMGESPRACHEPAIGIPRTCPFIG